MIYLAYALMTTFFIAGLPIMDRLAGYKKPKKHRQAVLEAALSDQE